MSEERIGLNSESTNVEIAGTILAMTHYGGSFVQRLAAAMNTADSVNVKRVIEAFPDIMTKYGPGSFFYSEVRKPRKAPRKPTPTTIDMEAP